MKKIDCILLPGLDGTGRLLAEFAAEISHYADPAIISYPEDLALNYRELTEYVLARLPGDKEYCIVAESFSGPIAISVASRNPARLRCLVLAATFASSPYPKLSRLAGRALPLLFKLPIPRSLISFLLLNGRRKDMIDIVHETANAIDRGVLASRTRNALGCDVTKNLKEISVPVLALRALHDRTLPKRCVDEMCLLLPTMRVASLDAPHCVLQVEAKRVSETILLPFLTSVLSSEV